MKLKLKSCVTYHVNKQHYFLSVLAALFYSTKEYKNSCWLLILLKLSLCRRVINQWRIFQSYLNSCNIRFMQQIRTGFCTCNSEKHDFKERLPTANKLKSYQSDQSQYIKSMYPQNTATPSRIQIWRRTSYKITMSSSRTSWIFCASITTSKKFWLTKKILVYLYTFRIKMTWFKYTKTLI